jgi:hypothetical protein
VVNAVDLGHVPLPIILPGEGFAASPGVIAALNRAVEFFLLFVTVIDMSLEMSLCAESFPACRVRAFVVLAVVPLMVPTHLLVLERRMMGLPNGFTYLSLCGWSKTWLQPGSAQQ